jgi:hypothetical protein
MRKTFKWKDYSVEGPDRYKVMTLAMDEFIPRQKNTTAPKEAARVPPPKRATKGRFCETCARAAIGQAAAAPPSSVMKLRLFNRSKSIRWSSGQG